MTGDQQSSPSPLAPSSVQSRALKAARTSVLTTDATCRISAGSNVAASEGPEGNDVTQRPSAVQLCIWAEWMQLVPQSIAIAAAEAARTTAKTA